MLYKIIRSGSTNTRRGMSLCHMRQVRLLWVFSLLITRLCWYIPLSLSRKSFPCNKNCGTCFIMGRKLIKWHKVFYRLQNKRNHAIKSLKKGSSVAERSKALYTGSRGRGFEPPSIFFFFEFKFEFEFFFGLRLTPKVTSGTTGIDAPDSQCMCTLK